MNKKYIFVYGSISGIGGRQLYLQRKAKYLQRNGWDVYLLTCNANNVVLEYFEQIKVLNVRELKYPIYYFDSNVIEKIIYKCLDFIGNINNELYIESQDIYEGVWAEHIAEKFLATNMIYIIGEPKLSEYNKFIKEFYTKKIMSNECVGVTEKTLDNFVQGILYRYPNNYINIPFDLSEIQQENESLNEFFIDIPTNYIKVFTIGRLEKEYIIKLIETIIDIANREKEIPIFLLVIGGSSNFPTLIDEYKNRYEKNYQNLIIRFTDSQTVLSPSLFNEMDIFVGMGTAAINAISQKCSTICINPLTLKSPGILGVTTKNFAFADVDKEVEIETVLLNLIRNKRLRNDAAISGYDLFLNEFENNKVNKYAIEFMKKIRQTDYFIYNGDKGLSNFNLRMIVFKLLGINRYEFFSSKIKGYRKHIKLFKKKMI